MAGEAENLAAEAGNLAAGAWPADAPLLRCQRVSYTYLERFPALREVDLEVYPGEKLALLGANGCGKSTLLKLIDGLIFGDSGSYTAFGEPITEQVLEDEQMSRHFRSRVGFVFQNSDAQVFSPTVMEEVAFGPLQLGMTRAQARQRVDDVLELLGIGELGPRTPFQLSGGQKKKVAIASVLAMNPGVLLFDEPTAALDPRTQEWLTDLIIQLSDSGKTIVHATHDLQALHRLADRCVVFSEEHRIVASGAPAEILADRKLLLEVNLIHQHSPDYGEPGRRERA